MTLQMEDFDYFVKYIKKLIKINKKQGKYLPNSKTLKYNGNEDPKIDILTGEWDIRSFDVVSCFKWSYRDTRNIFESISDKRAKEFVKQAKGLDCPIIESIGNNCRSELKKIRDTFYRKINGDILYNHAVCYIEGAFLLGRNFFITNEKKDLYITFMCPSYKDLSSNLIEHYLLQPREKFGLIVDIKIPRDSKKDNLDVSLQIEEYIMLNILKLIVQSSIHCFKVDYNKDAEYEGILGTCADFGSRGIHQGLINQNMVNIIKKYYLPLRNAMYDYKILRGEYESDLSPCYVAIENYSESLTTYEFSKKISLIIMGLEALYTSNKDNLAYTLRMRVTSFLKLLNVKTEKMIDIIKYAYEVRSDYAHGGINREKVKERLIGCFTDQEECLNNMVKSLRLSILCALLLGVGKKGDGLKNFHDAIDKMMIGDSDVKKMFINKLRPFNSLLK